MASDNADALPKDVHYTLTESVHYGRKFVSLVWVAAGNSLSAKVTATSRECEGFRAWGFVRLDKE